MSFDFPAQPQRQVRPRGGGCGRLIFMMVIMFAVYYMFSAGRPRKEAPDFGRGGPGEVLAPGVQPDDREDLKREIFGDGSVGSSDPRQPSGREMPSTGRSGAARGWEMEEVESDKDSGTDFRNDSRLPAPSSSQRRSKSDWSMGDAGDLNAEAVPAGRESTPLQKSKNGWKLEEVD